jgi:DNA polymerase-3 subunit chi
MTRIDFYLLPDDDAGAHSRFACRLVEKAYDMGHRIYIHTGSEAHARQLDELLWTFRAGSFLPHCIGPDATGGSTPIVLGHSAAPETINDVLVNLGPDVPAFFARFNRVAELADARPDFRQAARDRFRFYKDRGYTIKTHEIAG